MIERQDIDALLVGALYGELSPDERARLDVHLASHPQDRDALAGLTRARTAVRDSLIFTPAQAAEPPPAVSALLLQAAAKHAPAAEGSGFFARMVDWFGVIGRHPALSAAAMLLVVASAAGIVYMRGGRASDQVATMSPLPSGAAVAHREEQLDNAIAMNRAAAGSGYSAGLAEDLRAQVALAEKERDVLTSAAKATTGSTPATSPPKAMKPGYATDPYAYGGDSAGGVGNGAAAGDYDKNAIGRSLNSEGKADGAPGKPHGSIAMAPEETALKSLDRPTDEESPDTAATTAPAMDAKDSDADLPRRDAGKAKDKAPAQAATVKPAPAPANPNAAAMTLHTKLIALVTAGKCTEAGKLGSSIANRYPEYYASQVSTDRRVRACKPYIDRARQLKAEKSKLADRPASTE